MKKLDRFKFIENKFGSQYVLEYYACYAFEQICEAADKFEARNMPWNLRTDKPSNESDINQAVLAPFVHLCTKEKARAVWDEFGASLVYIVFRSMPLCYLNGVAIRVNDETVFIEYNEQDRDVPQRYMYEKADHLSHLNIGPFRRNTLVPEQWPGPVFEPTDAFIAERHFDEVYSLLLSSGEDEMTFALRYPDRQLIIW